MGKKEVAATQSVIIVDNDDKFLGKYAPRHKAHTGEGLHHRAFVCFLLNKKGQILLQKRKHWLWDGLWDLTAISHVLHLDGRDETYEKATARALKKEMGIKRVKVEKIGGFNYFAKHEKDDGCENEYCAIMFGRHGGEVSPNPEDVYEYKWMGFKKFVEDTKKHPKLYTPWAVLMVETLEKEGSMLKYQLPL